MLKIGQNWGKIANYPPQCLTKIGTTAIAHKNSILKIRYTYYANSVEVGLHFTNFALKYILRFFSKGKQPQNLRCLFFFRAS